MRSITVLLLVLFWGMQCCWAVDLFQQVPGNDPAYAALRHLDHCGLLPTYAKLQRGQSHHPLTNYEFALALTEPLKQFIALADTQSAHDGDPAQKQRGLLLNGTLSALSAADREQVIAEIGRLAQQFAAVVDEIQPGLSAQALAALRRLPKTPVISDKLIHTDDNNLSAVKITLNPNASLPYASLLPAVVMTSGGNARLLSGSDNQPVAMYPVKSLELALNSTWHGIGLTTTLDTLPGVNPLDIVNPLQMPGHMQIGVTSPDLLRFNNLGIRWMLDYHIQRYSDQGIVNTNKLVTTGMQILW